VLQYWSLELVLTSKSLSSNCLRAISAHTVAHQLVKAHSINKREPTEWEGGGLAIQVLIALRNAGNPMAIWAMPSSLSVFRSIIVSESESPTHFTTAQSNSPVAHED
jgi:hypothetical protein